MRFLRTTVRRAVRVRRIRVGYGKQRPKIVANWDDDIKPPDDDLQWPPFRSFGKEYYTYQLARF